MRCHCARLLARDIGWGGALDLRLRDIERTRRGSSGDGRGGKLLFPGSRCRRSQLKAGDLVRRVEYGAWRDCFER